MPSDWLILQVRELPPEDWLDGVKQGGNYVKGFWDRLNGGGRSSDRPKRLPAGLPAPASTKVQRPCFPEMAAGTA